ncbi:MAG: squalene/phytoene synthase family protein [Candidatus Rokubacteria bacterium]|nr:squalene/phytoene synthase family protein [Candidatus Rokubacteria bacterium]
MPDDLLGDLLKQVSRSFYLSLAILPRDLREPLGLAYLLARAADTVADTRLLPRAERVRHLTTLRAAYAGDGADVAAAAAAAEPLAAHAAERRLLGRVDEALARVQRLPEADRRAVREVLATLTSGMLFDLTRFPGEDAAAPAALDTLEELDHYTYLVAGCVGPFWTRLHAAHRRRLRGWDVGERSAEAVRFGQGLQMTNVLRDAPADLRLGRCYLPRAELAVLGLEPGDLLDPAGAARARPLYRRLLARTLEHYDVAWRYTLAIPIAEWRMRLACLWPLMIGAATLRLLARHPDPLAPGPPIRIPRAAVRRLVARSLVITWSNAAVGATAASLRRQVAL